MSGKLKLVLFVLIVLFPLAMTSTSMGVAIHRTQETKFCMSCHVMEPFTDDLMNPESETLASKHFQNRWIAKNQCYTCHTDYNWYGPMKSKLNGLRHAAAYYLRTEHQRPKLYEPYKNAQCLSCHGGGKPFENNEIHAAMMDEIKSEGTSCISCHGPVHPGKEGE